MSPHRSPSEGPTAVSDSDELRLSLLGRRLPPSVEIRIVSLARGAPRLYDDAEWHGAMVVVEHGLLVLECRSGTRYRFASGAILWLFGLPLRALHGCDGEATVLSVLRRSPIGAEVNHAR